jgi:hypothetical protein
MMVFGLALCIGFSTASAQDAAQPKKEKKAAAKKVKKPKTPKTDAEKDAAKAKREAAKAERIAKAKKRFAAKDKDGDGALTLEEMLAPKAKVKKPAKKKPAAK